ncbi:transcriptional regulator GcvA [Dechloromonas sp. XY25]|uniref:Transcriptional regulator GcvA n=1 Tax=Dechloromonas hankyongensis TaxID=2908002 RepID=A0ABS9K2C3_9RHOO|nr:transcriptional regulator GcvA [Dechloromonas hankyongensis]MCG2577327.1 transcriptional regulator GcvA [Dechloromonas hankyongensis]
MAYRLPPLGSLRAFESAARHLSFKLAAEELHVTPAAVSQQIKGLEDYLGVRLFVRLTRALAITPQGEAMLPKVRASFDCLAEAVAAVHAGASGGLNVTAPPSFATRWLVPRLPGFAAAHPEIRLRLSSSSDSVDRRGTGQRVDSEAHDPREVDSELSIRYGAGHYPGYIVERLLAPGWVPVCSPRLASSRPLRIPQDLAKHVLIHDETIDDAGRHPGWQEWLAAAGVNGVDSERGPRFSNAVLAVEAALDGQGVALALQPLIEADLAAGRLVVPFDMAVPSPFAYYLVMRRAVAGRPPVLAFRDWLLNETGARGASDEPAVDGV